MALLPDLVIQLIQSLVTHNFSQTTTGYLAPVIFLHATLGYLLKIYVLYISLGYSFKVIFPGLPSWLFRYIIVDYSVLIASHI